MAKRIVLFSTKGGAGRTLIATNLAVSLAKEQGKKVCLVDLDLQGIGDMARMLDLNPQKAMVDLINFLKEKPGEFRKEDFLIHSAIGLDFISGVLRPQQSPHLGRSDIKEIFNLLDKEYDFIVTDAGNSFNEIFLSTLNEANLILLIVTPDILSLYQIKWALDTLQFLHFPLNMIKLVLNRAESASSISWQEIKANFPIDIIARFPSEGKAVGLAVNRGIPVVMDSPNTKFSQAIVKCSAQLSTDDSLFIERQDVVEFTNIANADPTTALWEKEGLTESLTKPSTVEKVDELILLKSRIHKRLIDELDIKRLDLRVFSDIKRTKELKEKARIMVVNLLAEESGTFITSAEMRKQLVDDIVSEALGLGPLEPLLADPGITDIMVNNKNEVYIEKHGKIERTNKKFVSNEQVKTIIERIIAPLGRRIDESVPMVDARLTDGSRVNAVIPPLALTGPTLTIRKFRQEKLNVRNLIELKALDTNMAEFVKACVLSRKNIIVSGGTGSGKTTVLNALSEFIPVNERIITIEDAAELKLHQDHWVRLESRPPNIEGKGAITIRDLFRNTLRMRPDRIIIGECRGIETLDMLQAMNTGHDGSMTTIHANSTHDVLVRLDSMILMAGIELPLRAIHEMIVSAVDMIIHTARLSDGSRRITQITEIAGMKDDLHVDLRDVFAFKQKGIDSNNNVLGDYQATGYIPSFVEEIKIKGIPLPDSIFKPRKE
ncbi:MAG: ATPase, T2SS/T4P/T4SS family [Candidatus Omnitrophota bacterium]